MKLLESVLELVSASTAACEAAVSAAFLQRLAEMCHAEARCLPSAETKVGANETLNPT